MLRSLRKKRAQSAIEYITFITFTLAALFLFQKYISRSIAGQWKQAGETFGYGRIYDPNKTTECIYGWPHSNMWYNLSCFDQNNGDCLSVGARTQTCEDVITVCASPMCNQ